MGNGNVFVVLFALHAEQIHSFETCCEWTKSKNAWLMVICWYYYYYYYYCMRFTFPYHPRGRADIAFFYYRMNGIFLTLSLSLSPFSLPHFSLLWPNAMLS